ncbi:tetratricopeptide repeat protein [Falsiroseomonas tokyonensis]|uniref:Tetratricopeptide repeat protein n=1 Tax=Falsiroseomonas tokyonensis TaxID=430521 RepID=A0ABV7BTR0_9PROT|nr:tetratricopeptide repeat protein [Falsiroseomonas tokyonensis]MBU8537468.1 tetratricopeptide repeat protein [Falsiroseomonas tokyonensis]
MRRQTRTVLLGAFAAAAITALGAVAWVTVTPTPAQTAEDSLPTPPEPPRLADGPDYERCIALLRSDPEAARVFAAEWDARGGGDGARHCQALALLALGEPASAAQRLETLATRSQASNPARAAVYAQATQAWLMAGEANRAYGAATLALTLSPEDVDLLVDRAVALGSLSRYQEAIEDLDRALVLAPERAEALVFRAAAQRHLDRVELSARDIDRALAIDPQNPEALLERGIIRQLRGDTAGAREDWERAIAMAPNSATADLAAQNLALNEAGPARR